MAEYYAQRASAGLIIAEATMAMPECSAFWREPGIHSPAQIDGWRRVTDAVHAQDGRIFLQIWHGGRACHPALNGGRECVSASPLPIRNDEVHTPEGKLPYPTPRALGDEELPAIVDGFAQAANNARLAGFDGVEVHSANGYLLDQFLRDGVNQRTGPYGGAMENRARLLLEVLDAVTHSWSSDRVGVRISPLNSFNDMRDSDPVALTAWLAKQLNRFNLAYLHVMRSDMFDQQHGDVLTVAREKYHGVLIGNMGYSGEEADAAIVAGEVDAVAFGVPFLANPDLPARLQRQAALNAADPATFYTQDAQGYTDYPPLPA
ncbi:putative NADH:flavin oxidoreductase [Magnetofaba australis IT-1]|uniref:Putative NADH:flavin oxidoreductase n=2 Tax=Magnetofaba TaxID=1472292 RepID=A0A1Y2K6X0_9PROT|nr:putative NADH:flavin oxidoreductase [Magnetofaba australis IT-1]